MFNGDVSVGRAVAQVSSLDQQCINVGRALLHHMTGLVAWAPGCAIGHLSVLALITHKETEGARQQ